MIQEPMLDREPAAVAITHGYGKLPAEDVARARKFYDEKLGVTPFAEIHNHLYYEVAGVHSRTAKPT